MAGGSEGDCESDAGGGGAAKTACEALDGSVEVSSVPDNGVGTNDVAGINVVSGWQKWMVP